MPSPPENRQDRRPVVVDDRPARLGYGDGRAPRRDEPHPEGFDRFVDFVVEKRHFDHVIGFAGRESHYACVGHVVGSADGGAVLELVAHGHRSAASPGQGNREDRHAGLDRIGRIRNRDRRPVVVVLDLPRYPRRCDHGVFSVGEIEVESFVRLIERIVGQGHDDRQGLGVATECQRPFLPGVIVFRGRVVGRCVSHRDRHAARAVQRHLEGQIRALVTHGVQRRDDRLGVRIDDGAGCLVARQRCLLRGRQREREGLVLFVDVVIERIERYGAQGFAPREGQ